MDEAPRRDVIVGCARNARLGEYQAWEFLFKIKNCFCFGPRNTQLLMQLKIQKSAPCRYQWLREVVQQNSFRFHSAWEGLELSKLRVCCMHACSSMEGMQQYGGYMLHAEGMLHACSSMEGGYVACMQQYRRYVVACMQYLLHFLTS